MQPPYDTRYPVPFNTTVPAEHAWPTIEDHSTCDPVYYGVTVYGRDHSGPILEHDRTLQQLSCSTTPSSRAAASFAYSTSFRIPPYSYLKLLPHPASAPSEPSEGCF